MSLSGRLRQLRGELGISQEELAEMLNVQRNTVWRWENGMAAPKAGSIAKIAQALRTTTAYLLEGSGGDPAEWDAREVSVTPAPVRGELVVVPVLPISACMGPGFDNEGEGAEPTDTMYLDAADVGVSAPERPFALEVEGNSMSPRIEDGERVVVNPNIVPGHGDVCLARFRVGGWLRDALKYYAPKVGGGCVLRSSETSGIPPMEFSAAEVAAGDVVIVGRVVYALARGRRI